MLSPLTFRLEKKTRQRIARIASRRRISTSEVIRQAIEAWVERQEPMATPYEAMVGGNARDYRGRRAAGCFGRCG